MKKIFDGDVNIYLAGWDALTDGKLDKKSGLHTEFLIGHHPDLVVQDLRKLGWKDANGFNVKSLAKILYDDRSGKMRIVLMRPSEPRKKPKKTLVFGVIWNNSIPNYDADWEVFKPSPVNKKAIPFVTLIN